MRNKKRLSLFPGLALTAMFGAGLLTMAMPGQANAITAANAVIANVATVTYDDAGGTPRGPVSSSPCNVTVSLKVVNPTLTVDSTTGTTPSNAAKAYTYTLTNKSNGPDTFNLTRAASNIDAAITLSLVGPDPVLSTTTVTNLGATTVISLSGLDITVPSDGSAVGGVNYIAVGNTVMIGSNTYAVTAIADNATGTSTITVSDPGSTLAGDAVAGAQIGEQVTFTSTCTPVTTTDNKTYDVSATATSAGDNTKSATSATTTTTVTLPVLTVTKYVRNISDGSTCSGATALTAFDTGISGAAGAGKYCTSGVTGKPGEIMEYVIKVTNGGSTVANNVVITDPIPAYTRKVADTIALGPASGSFVITGTDTSSTDFAKLVGSLTSGTVWIYAGTGGTEASGGTGGSLAAGANTYGAFQVTIE